MPSVRPELIAPPELAATTACPLCGGAPVAWFGGITAVETGAAYGVVRCPGCGLGLTHPVPTDLAPYYDQDYYGQRHGMTARMCRGRRLGILQRRAGRGANRRLLDYGCGDGDFALAAQSRGWNVVGIERHRPAGIPANLSIVASLDDLVGQPPFDGATFWHVLEHLPDPVGVLDQVRAHLKPGGVVLAAVPNFASWQARVAGAGWLHLDLPRHLVHFTPAAMIKVFEAAGFAVEHLTFGEFEYDVVGWAQGLLNRFLGGHNEFFRAMSGRPGAGSQFRRGVQVAMGMGLVPVSAGLALLETSLGRGGTIVVAARAPGGRA